MRNLETKFRLTDVALARKRAEAIGFSLSATLVQHDTFFAVPNGKLKLREQPGASKLIHYHRKPEAGLKLSNYQIAPVPDGAKMRQFLAAALGIIAEVRKLRTLLERRNVRLHLDQVANLGDFGELEAVLGDQEDSDKYRVELAEILAALQIPPDQLIDKSYFELMG